MLKERIDAERTAARGNSQLKYDVLTMVKAGIEKEEKKDGKTLDDTGVEAVIRREIKQLNETIDVIIENTSNTITVEQAKVISASKAKINILETFVPKLMDESDIRVLVSTAIASLGYKAEEVTNAHRGQIMKGIMPRIKGKADGKLVAKVVDSFINK